jgi:hypothetical protein
MDGTKAPQGSPPIYLSIATVRNNSLSFASPHHPPVNQIPSIARSIHLLLALWAIKIVHLPSSIARGRKICRAVLFTLSPSTANEQQISAQHKTANQNCGRRTEIWPLVCRIIVSILCHSLFATIENSLL